MARFWSLTVLNAFYIIADQLIKGAFQTQDLSVTPFTYKWHFLQLEPVAFHGIITIDSPFLSLLIFKVIPFMFLIYFYYLFFKNISSPYIRCFGINLLIAGWGANLVDRFVLGHIQHYILIENISFNLSDFIFGIGLILIFISLIVDYRKKQRI